jgi:hypothetical protein
MVALTRRDRQWLPLRTLAVTLAAAACLCQAQPITPDLRAFLQKYAVFTNSEIAQLQDGQAVAKPLETSVKEEVAAYGMVRMDVPLDFFMDQFRDIVHFKEGPAIKEIGRFSEPPTPGNLDGLTLDSSDPDALAHCKAGNCAIKASVQMMQRFQRETGRTDTPKVLAASLREILSEYVMDYVARGDAALVSYADKKDVVRLQKEFLDLLSESSYLADYAHPLWQELAGFPRLQPPEVQSFLYWSKEMYGPKPVVSITQTMFYPTQRNGARWCFTASKQIYANHYFEGSLGTAVIVEESTVPTRPSVWVIYMNRSRVDALHGWFASVARRILAGRVRSGMADNLKLLKVRLEKRYLQSGKRG